MKRFIAIDGLDGSGKDTQARLIKEKYEKEGTVIIRSHPTTDNFFGRTSKNALQHEEETKWNKIVATIFYGADAIRSLIKYYGKYDTVIFVRYTLAVSYLKKSLSVPVYKLVCFALPVSEYFFYLDVSPKVLMERIEKRKDKAEIFENYDDFVKVRAKAEPVLYNWHVIPANDGPDVIFSRIETILDKLDAKLLSEPKKLE